MIYCIAIAVAAGIQVGTGAKVAKASFRTMILDEEDHVNVGIEMQI